MDRGAWWLQSTGSQESDATEQQHLLSAKNTPDTKKTWAKIHHTADCGHPGGTLVRGGHAALGRPLRGGHLDVVVRSMWDLSSWKTDDSPFSAPTDCWKHRGGEGLGSPPCCPSVSVAARAPGRDPACTGLREARGWVTAACGAGQGRPGLVLALVFIRL